MGVTGDFDTPVNKKNDGKPQKASLTVDYANFKVNTGLSDQLFKSE
jgi:outer membrane lipoprotein-sorting protein